MLLPGVGAGSAAAINPGIVRLRGRARSSLIDFGGTSRARRCELALTFEQHDPERDRQIETLSLAW